MKDPVSDIRQKVPEDQQLTLSSGPHMHAWTHTCTLIQKKRWELKHCKSLLLSSLSCSVYVGVCRVLNLSNSRLTGLAAMSSQCELKERNFLPAEVWQVTHTGKRARPNKTQQMSRSMAINPDRKLMGLRQMATLFAQLSQYSCNKPAQMNYFLKKSKTRSSFI